jgi:DNA topoisomerase-2
MTSAKDYQMLSPIEHVRARADMYVGSVKTNKEFRWVIDTTDGVSKALFEEVESNPGLEQCILELIVNAADHVERCKNQPKSNRVTKIIVEHTKEYFSICNNGLGIPIEVHKETKLYVPEMIFGNLRTSSNYDDSEKRTVGGRNGIGAKAANIFSNKFIVEVQTDGKKYIQEFTKGMNEKTDPVITKGTAKPYTKITFYPDFKFFDMKSFETNNINLLIKKRVYDLSAVTNKEVEITYNDSKIEFKDFTEYIKLYIGESPKVVFKTEDGRWEVGVSLNPYEQSTQISFVNAICTDDGGTHVNHVLDPVITKIVAELQKKNKDVKIQRNLVKDNIIIFIKSLIENPSFSSQLKRCLTTKVSDFGSKCEITDNDIKKIVKLGVCNGVVEVAKAKELKTAMKTIEGTKNTRLTDIAKLEDANWAGNKDQEKRMKCTLVLTEGDSAKGFAMNGIAAAGGSNIWGIFPLKGKFINIRTASTKQMVDNKEMISINRILGLKSGIKNITDLRYGKVMILTDSDVDGYHIKGLLLNYFTFNWPELVEKGLVECMITPLIKVFDHKNTVIEKFYNPDDFHNWSKTKDMKKFRVKYYKGLGTSTPKEAQICYSDLEANRISYTFDKTNDISQMKNIFDKDFAEYRKEWITGALKNPKKIDYNIKSIPVSYFTDRELVQFSIYDNVRSIPNIIDGLKPSQRKILFGCLKKNLYLKNDGSGEIKVAQLSGYISEHSAYHHGEASLQSTIVSMAQEFVGSGNLNLLLPKGEFGSRVGGGSDAASARYIFTALRPEVKILFNEHDNVLLNYLEDEGEHIEPDFYVPILPMLLLNGSVGIGTGWSTNIPCFRLKTIVDNIRSLLNSEDCELEELIPYYKGFKGTIENNGLNSWKSTGCIEVIDSSTIEITELPVGMWKQDFKEHLNLLISENRIKSYEINDTSEKTDKKKKSGKSKKINGSNDICYLIKLNRLTDSKETQLMINMFKLEKTIQGSNFIAFDEKCVIQKYGSANDILWVFYKYRLKFYKTRKDYLIADLNKRLFELNERLRFITMVVNNELVIFKQKKDVIRNKLEKLEFKDIESLESIQWTKFTEEEIEKLKKKIKELLEQLEQIQKKSIKKMWLDDLDQLDIEQLEKVLEIESNE